MSVISDSPHPRRPNINIGNMIGIIVAKKIAEKYNTLEKLVEIFEEANIELREKYVRGELIIRDDFMVKAK
jgi:hypothetical protein